VLLELTTDRHEASRGLFATAELLVVNVLHNIVVMHIKYANKCICCIIDAGVAYVQRQPILFLPPPPSNPPPRDLITPPRSTPSRSGRHRRVARDARSRDSVELDLPYGRSPSPRATWSHVTCVEPRSLYSPHAMSEPGCMTSSDRVTDDVMAGGRGGSFDLSEIRHYSDTDGVLLVDQSALLHHEFSPPSPAPQDALSHTASSVNNDR